MCYAVNDNRYKYFIDVSSKIVLAISFVDYTFFNDELENDVTKAAFVLFEF